MITLDEVKTYLGITGTDDDDYLLMQIAASESMVQTYCGREFDKMIDAEQVITGPNDKLFITRFPLEIVSSIINEDGTEYADTEFTVNNKDGVITFSSCWDTWRNAKQLTVTFTGGYEEIPADLKAVLLDMVATRYYQRGEDVTRPLKADKVDGIGSRTYAVSNDFFGGLSGFGNFGVTNYSGVLDLYRIETVIA